jgi:NitT/TauT family transport system substrate-binding protein
VPGQALAFQKQRMGEYLSKVGMKIAQGAALTLLAFALACSLDKPQTRQTLAVARVGLPVTVLIDIAAEKGYFEDEKLDVKVSDFVTGREALNSMNAGHQDLAVAFTTPTVHDIAAGKDTVILSTLHESEQNTAIVALVGHGINEPKDLQGKTVGASLGTSGEFYINRFLTDSGLDPGSVGFRDVKISDALAVLQAGSVDAVVAWNPYLAQIQEAFPPESIRLFRTSIYQEMSLLVGPREVVNRKNEAILRFVRALSRAEDLLAQDLSGARQAGARHAKGSTHLDPGSPVWNDFTPRLGLNHVMLLSMEQDAEWMRSTGAYAGPLPALRQQIDDRYLREVRPDSVTLPLRSDLPDAIDSDSDGHEAGP